VSCGHGNQSMLTTNHLTEAGFPFFFIMADLVVCRLCWYLYVLLCSALLCQSFQWMPSK